VLEDAVNQILGFFIGIVLSTLTLSLGEELGWRGYLLPQLLSVGRTRALVLVGLIWAAWHMPLIFLTPPLPFGGEQVDRAASLRGNHRGGMLLFRLPQDLDGQRVARLYRALFAQRRLGHPRGVYGDLKARGGQRVSGGG
jgi:hypothetical protein